MNLPVITIQNDSIPVFPSSVHEWTLPTTDVARGYGVGVAAIRKTKERHEDELTQGKHWISVTNCHGDPGHANPVHWTKRGVIRLGFFLRSPRAKLFRDAAEDLILRGGDSGGIGSEIASLVSEEVRRQVSEEVTRHLAVLAPPSPAPVPEPEPPKRLTPSDRYSAAMDLFCTPEFAAKVEISICKELSRRRIDLPTFQRSVFIPSTVVQDWVGWCLPESPRPMELIREMARRGFLPLLRLHPSKQRLHHEGTRVRGILLVGYGKIGDETEYIAS
jgi:hypothetical protein